MNILHNKQERHWNNKRLNHREMNSLLLIVTSLKLSYCLVTDFSMYKEGLFIQFRMEIISGDNIMHRIAACICKSIYSIYKGLKNKV